MVLPIKLSTGNFILSICSSLLGSLDANIIRNFSIFLQPKFSFHMHNTQYMHSPAFPVLYMFLKHWYSFVFLWLDCLTKRTLIHITVCASPADTLLVPLVRARPHVRLPQHTNVAPYIPLKSRGKQICIHMEQKSPVLLSRSWRLFRARSISNLTVSVTRICSLKRTVSNSTRASMVSMVEKNTLDNG